jgi:ribonuclease HI
LNAFRGGVLEVQAIKLRLGSGNSFSILNLYNPNAAVTFPELLHYTEQLDEPFILTGDFNAHSPLLSSACSHADTAGQSLEQLIMSTSLTLLNAIDFYTYIDRRTGRCSCLDLFLISSDVAPFFHLERLRDVGSDHYPIMASSNIPLHTLTSLPVPKWKPTPETLHKLPGNLTLPSLVQPASVDEVAERITSGIIDAASACIPRTSGKHINRQTSPWWNEACGEAVKGRNRARRALERHPTRANLIEYKRCQALARNRVFQSKRRYKREFLSSITYTTPIGVAWRKIRLLRSRFTLPMYPIVDNGQMLSNTLAKANLLCRNFQAVGESGDLQAPADLHRIIVGSWAKTGDYNCPFSRDELCRAMRRMKMTTPGRDEIHNSFLKALSDEHKDSILTLYNQSFQLGILPNSWKEGIILPILKPGKDPTLSTSYRPITLLSCLGKLLERLVAARLEYVVDHMSLLSPNQCGFRHGHSTMDVLLRLEKHIRLAQVASEVCLVVYIDLQSAFDKVWVDGLLYKLAIAGIGGAMARWLHAYLTSRTARVRVNGVLSDPLPLSAGVPQGAVLSPLLFNLMLMDVPQLDGVNVLLYADDITVCVRGTTMGAARALAQHYLNIFRAYCTTWGLVVNAQKTVFQYFTHKRLNVPVLRYGQQPLRYEQQHKLLGLILDAPRLKWGPHLCHLRTDVIRRMDLLKHLASPNWGVSCRFLRLFYCAYIRAKIDYGCVLYQTASSAQLSKLDILQNACLRLVLGARRTTPVISLGIEAHVPPLAMRRQYLTASTYIRLQYRPAGDHTAAAVCGGATSVLSWGPQQLTDLGLPVCYRKPLPAFDPVPPWICVTHLICLDFRFVSGLTDSTVFSAHIREHYPGYKAIYCDGSRLTDNPSTACGLYIPSQERAVAWRLNPRHGILSAELIAILHALKLVVSETSLYWVIFSDSLVALQLLCSPTDTSCDLVYQIRQLLLGLNERKTVRLQWVKAHADIIGNERADAVAKMGHTLDRSALFHLSCSDTLALLRSCFVRSWELDWISVLAVEGKGHHLASVRTDLSPVPWVASCSRRAAVVLTRLRLGHAGVRSYLHRFGMADTPMCLHCGVEDTVEHFLLACTQYRLERRVLINSIQALGVLHPSVRILLGGGNFCRNVQHAIIRATVIYLTQTNRLASL